MNRSKVLRRQIRDSPESSRRYWAGKRARRSPRRQRYAAAPGSVTHTPRFGGGILVRPPRLRPQSSALDSRRIRFDDGICQRVFARRTQAPLGHASAHAAMRGLGTFATRWRNTGQRIVESEPWILWRYSTRHWLGNPRGLPRQPATQPQRVSRGGPALCARIRVGQRGSGGAPFALALLLRVTDRASAVDHYPAFRWEIIASLTQADCTLALTTIRDASAEAPVPVAGSHA